jgi:hypothetical protein
MNPSNWAETALATAAKRASAKKSATKRLPVPVVDFVAEGGKVLASDDDRVYAIQRLPSASPPMLRRSAAQPGAVGHPGARVPESTAQGFPPRDAGQPEERRNSPTHRDVRKS